VSYFTADSFRDFLELASETAGVFNGFTMKTERNNKDFGFLLWKRGEAAAG
jgi:hypothetical protein